MSQDADTDPSAPWSNRLVAGLVAALATVIIIGWIAQWAPLIQIRSDWAPVQFNTALGFLLLGTGIFLARRIPAAAICGTLVALIGAIALSSHIANAQSVLDELFVKSLAETQNPFPGRMSPNTAFAFCMTGVALTILGTPALAGRLLAAATSLGLVAAMLGLLSLLACFVDMPDIIDWRAFTAMAPATGVAFVLTGAVLARTAARRLRPAEHLALKLMPSAVGLILLLTSFNLWQAQLAQTRSRLSDETLQMAERTRQMISDRVLGQMNLMELMARRWSTHMVTRGHTHWQEDAELLLTHFPYIDGIGLTDQNMIYRHATYRGPPREVIGTRADRDEQRRSVFLAAIAGKQVLLTPALELIQGGSGFVIVAPVLNGERLLGLALAGVHFSDLLRTSSDDIKAGFAFSVIQDAREIYRSVRVPEGITHAFEQTIDLELPGAAWRVAVWPTKAHIDDSTGILPHLVLMFGVVAALLAWVTLWIAQLGAIKNRTLSRMTHILESQVAERRKAEAEVRMLNADLEERVRQRTLQLEEINRELESFSYSVSHDLRAPLASIAGFSKMLSDDHGPRLGPDAMHYVERIGSNITRMGQIIDDLLALARVSRSELFMQEVDLTTLANDVFGRLLERDDGRNVELRIADNLRVRADLNLMEIVLENLLSNALKFTGKRDIAIIEIGSEIRDERNFVFVRDNGVGYDMAYDGKLFGVFQRLHSSSEFPGNGIGLATVKRIIARHHGEIGASSAPGKGAVFFFWLPD